MAEVNVKLRCLTVLTSSRLLFTMLCRLSTKNEWHNMQITKHLHYRDVSNYLSVRRSRKDDATLL